MLFRSVLVHDYAAAPANSPALHEFEVLDDPAALATRGDVTVAVICCPWPQYRAVKFPATTTVVDSWGVTQA